MSLRRHALLIAAPKLKNLRDHPGTQVDVAEMRRWMLSNQGGAWEDEEIKVFDSNPSWKEIKPWVEYQAECDYVFNAFAGHGYMVRTDYGGTDTVVCLRDGQDIRVKALNPGNKRCTILADCCRNLSVIIPAELIEVKKAYAKFAEVLHRGRFRQLFDNAVASAEEGATYLYSCGEKQSAADDDNQGGLFTFQLLKSAHEWVSCQSRNAVLYMDKVFEMARAQTNRIEPQQHPYMPPVRRLKHFPFAVTYYGA